MKIAYISPSEIKVSRPTKKQVMQEAAMLIASQSRNSLSSRRRAQRIFDLVVNAPSI